MDMGRKWQFSVPVRVICVENRWCVTLLHAVMRIRMNYYTDPEILHMDPDPRKQILISIFSQIKFLLKYIYAYTYTYAYTYSYTYTYTYSKKRNYKY